MAVPPKKYWQSPTAYSWAPYHVTDLVLTSALSAAPPPAGPQQLDSGVGAGFWLYVVCIEYVYVTAPSICSLLWGARPCGLLAACQRQPAGTVTAGRFSAILQPAFNDGAAG
eukprot:SAG25_NODE_2030_length_2012_cov_4.162572_2_plen_112_part_00